MMPETVGTKPVGFRRWRAASDAAKARYARRRRWRENQPWSRVAFPVKVYRVMIYAVVSYFVIAGVILLFLSGLVARDLMQMRFPEAGPFAQKAVVSENTHWATADRLVVARDPGGSIKTRLSYVRWLRDHAVAVEVREMCASACTLYLTLDEVCTYPSATWMFHPMWTPQQNSGARDIYMKASDWAAAEGFPEPLRSWLREREWGMAYEDEIWLTGQELIETGWASRCDGPDITLSEGDRIFVEALPKIRPNPLPVRP